MFLAVLHGGWTIDCLLILSLTPLSLDGAFRRSLCRVHTLTAHIGYSVRALQSLCSSFSVVIIFGMDKLSAISPEIDCPKFASALG